MSTKIGQTKSLGNRCISGESVKSVGLTVASERYAGLASKLYDKVRALQEKLSPIIVQSPKDEYSELKAGGSNSSTFVTQIEESNDSIDRSIDLIAEIIDRVDF